MASELVDVPGPPDVNKNTSSNTLNARIVRNKSATTIAGDITPPDAPGFRGKVELARLDVSSPEDWTRVVDGIVARHGGIDILVNNAGIVLSYEPVHATDVESWAKVIAVNQTGTFLGAANWLKWLSWEGKSFADRAAVAARLAQLVERLENWHWSV